MGENIKTYLIGCCVVSIFTSILFGIGNLFVPISFLESWGIVALIIIIIAGVDLYNKENANKKTN